MTMKLTPMNAEEATARSEPLRLAAKRSPPPPASVASRVIGGVRRRYAPRAFEATPPESRLRVRFGIEVSVFCFDRRCARWGLELDGGTRRERNRCSRGGAGEFTTGNYYSNSSFLSFLVPGFALPLLGLEYSTWDAQRLPRRSAVFGLEFGTWSEGDRRRARKFALTYSITVPLG